MAPSGIQAHLQLRNLLIPIGNKSKSHICWPGCSNAAVSKEGTDTQRTGSIARARLFHSQQYLAFFFPFFCPSRKSGPLLCSQVSLQDLDLNTSKCNLASFLEGAGLWERGCTMAALWFSGDNKLANLFKPKSQGDLPFYRRSNPMSLEQLPLPELKELGSLSVSHLHRRRGHSVPTLCNNVLFAQ